MKLTHDIQTRRLITTASNLSARRSKRPLLAECLDNGMVVSLKDKESQYNKLDRNLISVIDRYGLFYKLDQNLIFVTQHSTIYLFCTVLSDTNIFLRKE